MLKVGDKAPDFTLPADDGSTVSLKDLRGKKVILYFYPKDDTSGCTAEACDFRDNIKTFRKKDVVIIGVSKDSVKSHTKFKNKFDLNFPLLSDEEGKMIGAYGVWKEKTMYGRKFMGIVRTTFIIDDNGVIEKVFENVKVPKHVETLLSEI
jgi:thioredoxin-dependent peroxiredoxin